MTVNSEPTTHDVLWLGPDEVDPSHAPLLRWLDRLRIRVVAEPEGLWSPSSCQERILDECRGAVVVVGREALDSEGQDWAGRVQLMAHREMPVLVFVHKRTSLKLAESEHNCTGICIDDLPPIMIPKWLLFGPCEIPREAEWEAEQECPQLVQRFADTIFRQSASQPYVFLIGRLERDFAQARAAIRCAVETELGIACIWADDGTLRASIESVRATTQQLIQDACLVIADLTLGPENPKHENPSRAHEIGMAIAYGKKLMLCSREPRRYPYFSIADHQMFFWKDEAELEVRAREWLRSNRAAFGRRVLNFLVPQWDPTYQPCVRRSVFRFDPARAYLWKRSRVFSEAETWAMAFSVAATVLSLAQLGELGPRIGDATYALAALAAAIVLLAMSRVLSPVASYQPKGMKAIPGVMVGVAVAITIIALVRSAVGQ